MAQFVHIEDEHEKFCSDFKKDMSKMADLTEQLTRIAERMKRLTREIELRKKGLKTKKNYTKRRISKRNGKSSSRKEKTNG